MNRTSSELSGSNKLHNNTQLGATSSGGGTNNTKTDRQQQSDAPQIRIRAGQTEVYDGNSSGGGKRGSSRRNHQASSRSTLKRVETTGEKQSAAQIREMVEQSDGEPSGSVNIQTDAISFERHALDVKSITTGADAYKKQKSAISFKSSKKSAGGGIPPMPPSIYGQTQKIKKLQSKRSDSTKTLNVSQLDQSQPDKLNAVIQRDIARMQQTKAFEGDQNLMIPGSHADSTNQTSSSLLAPFPRTLQKQTTGRNEKKEKKSNQPSDSSGLLLAPGFVMQRGLTKVENSEEDQQQESLDQQDQHFLALTSNKSLKSITRPSNVSGMASVISPTSRSRGDDNDEDEHSNISLSDFPKPSVHFGQFDQAQVNSQINQGNEADPKIPTAKLRGSTSTKSKQDLQSQKSFQTHDSKTIVTVATQIQILEPGEIKSGEVILQPVNSDEGVNQEDQAEKKIAKKVTAKKEAAPSKQSNSKKQQPVESQVKTGPASGKSKTGASVQKAKPQDLGLFHEENLTAVHKPSKYNLISSRAQRDVASEKGTSGVKLGSQKSGGVGGPKESESPLGSGDMQLPSSLGSPGTKAGGTLKSIQGGLLSIQEQPGLGQDKPQIKIENLGEFSPQVRSRKSGAGPGIDVQSFKSSAYGFEARQNAAGEDSAKTNHDRLSAGERTGERTAQLGRGMSDSKSNSRKAGDQEDLQSEKQSFTGKVSEAVDKVESKKRKSGTKKKRKRRRKMKWKRTLSSKTPVSCSATSSLPLIFSRKSLLTPTQLTFTTLQPLVRPQPETLPMSLQSKILRLSQSRGQTRQFPQPNASQPSRLNLSTTSIARQTKPRKTMVSRTTPSHPLNGKI